MFTFQNTALVVITVSIVAYGIIRAETAFSGPSATIDSHIPYQTSPQEIRLTGEITNAVFLSVNDRRIYPDGDGRFETYLVLPTGYTVITVHTKDRHGRENDTLLPLYIREYADKKESDNEER